MIRMLKQIVVLCSMFLFISGKANAQDDSLEGRNSISVMGGPLFSTITPPSFSGNPSMKYTLGYATGLAYTRYLGKQNHYGLVSELNMVQCGTQFRTIVTDGLGNPINSNALIKDRFSYLRFSELFKVAFLKKHLIICAGPYAGLLLKGTFVCKDPHIENTITKSYQKVDFGATAGLGYAHYFTSSWCLSAGLRGWMGAKDITTDPLNSFLGSKHLSYGLQFSLEKRF